MTTPLVPNFGQTLAYAERTLTASLTRHLAKREITPETWYALHLIATGGPGLDRRTLSGELEGTRTLTRDSVRELLARLEAEGLIQGDSELDLTADGRALHGSLREYVFERTEQLLSRFAADDVDTTMRTLRAITKQVTEELAAAD